MICRTYSQVLSGDLLRCMILLLISYFVKLYVYFGYAYQYSCMHGRFNIVYIPLWIVHKSNKFVGCLVNQWIVVIVNIVLFILPF